MQRRDHSASFGLSVEDLLDCLTDVEIFQWLDENGYRYKPTQPTLRASQQALAYEELDSTLN